MQALRYAEYYNMQKVFDDLYAKSKDKTPMDKLYDIIISRENILLAYRMIKRNQGSNTPGVNDKTIKDFENLTDDQLVNHIRKSLANFIPQEVRRVFIPKPNGNMRPLGIPTMRDRIIQQCFKQVLEPIVEARFYKHSYGFRPDRSTKHAIYRVHQLIHRAKLHYVVDIDIKGFFDNVNHRKLIKQLWNIGIHDRKVLRIISKMLKAPIKGEGVPTKGVPQGGILSPLLANVVLNDLDQWVASQWHYFPSKHQYSSSHKYQALKKTNLKEGWIVRYADDFKILTRDWKTAWKWYHAVKDYLKNHLKLDTSPEKSKVINLRKNRSDFLGISLKVHKAEHTRSGYITRSKLKEKKKEAIIKELRLRIKQLSKSPSARNANLYNSFILGLHNYFKMASWVSIEFGEIAFRVSRLMHNRLKTVAKYEVPVDPPPTYSKLYKNNYKTYKIDGVYLFPIADISFQPPTAFNDAINRYTAEGRRLLIEKLKPSISGEITKLLQSNVGNRSVEYFDNRISRFSMAQGKCEISGIPLTAETMHCHHVVPLHMGGTDRFDNLRVMLREYHTLLHATDPKTTDRYMNLLKPDKTSIKRLNKYRKILGLEKLN